MGTAAPELGADASLQFFIDALSGKSVTITTCKSSSPQEVSASIEDFVGIPFKNQRWMVDCTEILFQEYATIGETDLKSGDRITVMHGGFALVDLPDAFETILTSARNRMNQVPVSSCNFIRTHKIQVNSQEEWMYYEPWRKHDCDKYLFDVKADTLHAVSSKWMTWKRSLRGREPLSPFCLGWSSSHTQVPAGEKCFWRSEGQEDECGENGQLETGNSEHSQTFPDYAAVPGWFVAPFGDLCEIKVEIPLPFVCTPTGLKIIRLLIDKKGLPIRAAVQGCKVGFFDQDIEEFDVDFLPHEALCKPVLTA